MSKNVFARAAEGAGPYNVVLKLELARSGSEGSTTNVGVTAWSGKWMSEYSYTLRLSGPVTSESNQGRSLGGTTSQSAQNVKIKATGAGEVSVKLVVKNPPTAKPWVTTGNVMSHDKTVRSQNLVVLGKKALVEGTAKANERNTEFAPFISTQVKVKKIVKDSGLVDAVTTKADSWAKTPGSDKYVLVKATVDVYGLFNSPVAQTNGGKAFADKEISPYDATFNGPRTLDTVSTIKALSKGLYSFQARVKKSA